MSDPIVLGVDPGFASFGWSVVRLSSTPEVLAAGVIRTKKSAKKQRVLASEDSVVRARAIFRELRELIAVRYTGDEQVGAVCAEAMSWPRNASAATKVALAWGALVSVADMYDLPLLQASPQQVKLAVCGKRDASKDEVKAAVAQRTADGCWEAINRSDGPRGPLPLGLHEHMFDAIAVALTCADAEVIKLLRRAT